MDHFYQLPMLGAPEEPMLEAYTALGALATAATEKGPTGHPGHRQHVSQSHSARQDHHHPRRDQSGPRGAGGRTGWFELEHDQLGYEFGTFTERFAKLDEALKIILPDDRRMSG